MATPASIPLPRSLPGRLALLLALGAVLGPVGDLFHVLSRTDGYPPAGPGQLRIIGLLPLWVPALFAGATPAIAFGNAAADRWLASLASSPAPRRPGLRTWGRVLAGLLALLAIWAASGFLPLATGGPKDAVIAALSLAVWYALDRTWQGLALGLATAILSTPVEMLLVHAGAFYYYPEATNFLGVPSWLPWIYFTASVSVGNFGRALLAGLQGD
jgi:hypothetical protein